MAHAADKCAGKNDQRRTIKEDHIGCEVLEHDRN